MNKTEAGAWISAEPMVEWTPPDLSELDHAISVLRQDDEHGLCDGLIRFRDRIKAACQPVLVSALPHIVRNNGSKVVASVFFDSFGKPWRVGADKSGRIFYRVEHVPADAAPSSVATDDARAVLQDLLDHVDETTCTHESTHRGGAIWTICDNCDAKWADDRGGFKPHEDAPAVARARAMLASGPPASPDTIAWIRYCSDGAYEGPIHDSQMDDIRRKSGAWTPLGRLRPALPKPETEDRGSITGVVSRIGDDETGHPRILIRTTRDQIKAFGPNLVYRPVSVRLVDPDGGDS